MTSTAPTARGITYSRTHVALDAQSGKLVWYYQLIHHDLWDYDAMAAPQLLTVRRDGEDIPIVAQASKQGFVYVFNRTTGKPLWPIEERAVPASNMPDEELPREPFPSAPPPFARQAFTVADLNPYILSPADRALWKKVVENAVNHGLFTPPGVTDTIEMPGNHGGVNRGMTAANPADGRCTSCPWIFPLSSRMSAASHPPSGKFRARPLPPYKARRCTTFT